MRAQKTRYVIIVVIMVMSLARVSPAQLYVSNYAGGIDNAGSVGKYDPATGAVINASFIVGLHAPTGVAVDNNGHLFVASSGSTSTISEYDANTGATINPTFIAGLADPSAILLDGLGNLYVANLDGSIGKYNAVTGATINASFVSTAHPFGLALDSQRRLYATNNSLSSVLVFNADTGANIAVPLISGGAQGMEDPIGIVVDGASHLFIANYASGVINEFDAMTGSVINPSLVTAAGSLWGMAMDTSGNLFVANLGSQNIGKFNATTGAPINGFSITGLHDPQFIAIAPEPSAFALAGLCAASLLARRKRAVRKTKGYATRHGKRNSWTTNAFRGWASCSTSWTPIPSASSAGRIAMPTEASAWWR